MQTESTFFFSCANGHQMPAYKWLPAGQPKMVILLVHGMAEHAGRYTRFAKALNTEGFAVFANDLYGHGRDVTNEQLLGTVCDNWFNRQVDDLREFVFALKQRIPGVPVFLFGHSMGSFLAQRFSQLYSADIDGLVLSGTNGFKDPLLPAGIFLSKLLMQIKSPGYKSRLLNTLTFGKFNNAFKPNRTAFDWLSRDADEVDKYIADPACGFIGSVQLYYHLFKALQIIFDEKSIAAIRKDLPVYAFAGEKDPVGMQGKGFMKLVDNWKAAGIRNLEYKLYRDGRHEMLNETNRDEVMNDCIRWLKKYAWLNA